MNEWKRAHTRRNIGGDDIRSEYSVRQRKGNISASIYENLLVFIWCIRYVRVLVYIREYTPERYVVCDQRLANIFPHFPLSQFPPHVRIRIQDGDVLRMEKGRE